VNQYSKFFNGSPEVNSPKSERGSRQGQTGISLVLIYSLPHPCAYYGTDVQPGAATPVAGRPRRNENSRFLFIPVDMDVQERPFSSIFTSSRKRLLKLIPSVLRKDSGCN